MPEQGDRKIVNGVEKYYDYEYGWIDLPKKKTPKKPAGRSYDPKFEKDIDLSQDPDLMGYDLDIIKPGKTKAQELLEEKIKDVRKLADLRGSVTPGSSEAAATNLGEGIQMDNADKYRPGAGFPEGVVRPTYYPTVSKEAPTPTPTPTPASVSETAVKPDDGRSEITNLFLQETPFEYDYQWVPGYRENPLTAGSMKGDHRHINPRLKAQLAVKERNERSRERKAWREVVDDIPKPTFDYRADNFNDPEIIDENLYLKDLPNSSFIDISKYKPLF